MRSARQIQFLQSPDGVYVKSELSRMQADPAYITPTTFTTLTEDKQLLFVDKHMNYLSQHAAVDPMQYLMNLKLMTKKSSF